MTRHRHTLFLPALRRVVAIFQILLLAYLSLGGVAPSAAAQSGRVSRTQRGGVRERARAAVRRRGRALTRQSGRLLSFQTTQELEGSGEREAELRQQRLDWFLLQRSYPSPYFNLPPLLRSNAQEKTFQLEAALEATLSAAEKEELPYWLPLGGAPIESFGTQMRPTTGRVTAVVVS